MGHKYYPFIRILFFLSVFSGSQSLSAQTDDQKLTATILHQDSLFWVTYNTCDTLGNIKFFTADVEFYHDKGGLTLGAESLSEAMKKNLCGANNFRLRREAVEGSVKVFPLRNATGIYGAILSGAHVFYVLETGKNERLDGLAKFTHVWILKDSVWKMSRILSYDHGPAPYSNKREEQKLSAIIYNRFTGTYKGPKSGTISIRTEKGSLVLVSNNKTQQLYAETENRFFMKERDLTFEFITNEKQVVSKMVVREAGAIAEELAFIK